MARKQTRMKKFVRNISILLLPFLLMVLVNEVTRITSKEKRYTIQGIRAINSAEALPEKCTWACHNKNGYCKTHHVKYLKPFYAQTDVFYFGVIAALASTGNYAIANIIFLVLLFPIAIWYFIIQSLNIQDKIRKLSN